LAPSVPDYLDAEALMVRIGASEVTVVYELVVAVAANEVDVFVVAYIVSLSEFGGLSL
jgi:hypothetical protein